MERHEFAPHFAFVRLGPGDFRMGSPPGEPGRFEQESPHRVRLSAPFWLQTTPVTVADFRAFVADTGHRTDAEQAGRSWCHVPRGGAAWQRMARRYDWAEQPGGCWWRPHIEQGPTHPVTCVSWNDALAYCEWLSRRHARTFRLPSEAEWEYACRAGTDTAYHTGAALTHAQARFGAHARGGRLARSRWLHFALRGGRSTAAVGSYPANAWGLHDMHGNVWEWCADHCTQPHGIHTDTYVDGVCDPLCHEGDRRILRGGSWFYRDEECRSAHRRALPPEFSASGIGFRVAFGA